MKRFYLLLIVLFVLVSCATTQKTYTPQVFTPPTKSPEYKLPEDPFANIPAPVSIFLKKDSSGKYVLCSKEEAEIVGFTGKELNKIVLRLDYYKTQLPQVAQLVNLHIQREDLLINLIVDQNILKELFREMYIEAYNKGESQQFWNKVQQGGYWAMIIALVIEIAMLAK